MDVVQADQLNAINIPKAPGNFHIEIFYNEAGSHFDLIPMNSHNILPPPQLPEEHMPLTYPKTAY